LGKYGKGKEKRGRGRRTAFVSLLVPSKFICRKRRKKKKRKSGPSMLRGREEKRGDGYVHSILYIITGPQVP